MAEKILIVEDESILRETLDYNFTREGYLVEQAVDGPAAIAAARAHSPDLIVLDLMLPGIDGFEVCRSVRRESNMPILMLTARDAEVDRVVGLEVGADGRVVWLNPAARAMLLDGPAGTAPRTFGE